MNNWNKYFLRYKETGEEKRFKNLRFISDELKLPYHVIRQIYLHYKKPRKNMHDSNRYLFSKYAIFRREYDELI